MTDKDIETVDGYLTADIGIVQSFTKRWKTCTYFWQKQTYVPFDGLVAW